MIFYPFILTFWQFSPRGVNILRIWGVTFVRTEGSLCPGFSNSIDDVFKNEYHRPNKYPSFFSKLDTTQIKYLFHRGVSFRSIRGTYNSLISDGKSGYIKNRELFQEIQEIYDELNQRIASTYEGLKVMESKIFWAYPYQKKHWTYSDLKNMKEDKIFLDLSNFTEQKYFYAQDLFDLKERMLKVVKLLEKELAEK